MKNYWPDSPITSNRLYQPYEGDEITLENWCIKLQTSSASEIRSTLIEPMSASDYTSSDPCHNLVHSWMSLIPNTCKNTVSCNLDFIHSFSLYLLGLVLAKRQLSFPESRSLKNFHLQCLTKKHAQSIVKFLFDIFTNTFSLTTYPIQVLTSPETGEADIRSLREAIAQWNPHSYIFDLKQLQSLDSLSSVYKAIQYKSDTTNEVYKHFVVSYRKQSLTPYDSLYSEYTI